MPEGEAAKDWNELHELLAGLAERQRLPRHADRRAWRGERRRPRRARRLAVQARLPGRPSAHHPARPGRQRDRRQDRDRRLRREESGRHLPPARAGRRRSRLPRHARRAAVALRLCRDRQIWADRRSRLLRLVRSQWARRPRRRTATFASRRSARAIRAKARIVAGDVDDRIGQRALLNLGHSFAHAIEAEAGLGIDPSRRGGGARHGARLPLLVGARPLPRRRHRAGRRPSRRCRTAGAAGRRRDWRAAAQKLVELDAPRQEERRRQGRAGPGSRDRPGLPRPAVDERRLAAFLDRAA